MIPIAFLSYFNNCNYSIAVFTFLSPLSTLHDWSSTFCIRISPVSDPQPIPFPPRSHFTCHFHLLPFPPISLDNYWHPSLSRVMDYISHQYPGATGSWSGLGHQFSPQMAFTEGWHPDWCHIAQSAISVNFPLNWTEKNYHTTHYTLLSIDPKNSQSRHWDPCIFILIPCYSQCLGKGTDDHQWTDEEKMVHKPNSISSSLTEKEKRFTGKWTEQKSAVLSDIAQI